MRKFRTSKIISMALIAAMAVSVSSCGNQKKQDEYKRTGIEQMDDGQYDKALKSFNKALALSSTVGRDEKDIALYKASAQHELGKNGDAINTLNGLMKFDADDYKAVFLRGCIYADINRPQKAVADLKKACSLSKRTSLYESAYQTLISVGMDDCAEDFYDDMPKEARASKKVLKLRVIGFEKKADFASALDSADSYLTQFPDDEDMKKEEAFLKLQTGS
ncbi:MAG: hypothetical protein PUG04_05655 [Lachnospiraceae bacterium]|nr:hypothetical protein [Lachnospiraceae bacterium]